jgi:glycosyltransferase involved in cell wall biosynthesis
MKVRPNLYALWTGNGPDWASTQAAVRATATADRHRFVEWTRTPERNYAALDCLVAPSLAPETFGRVVAEAQACGVPVIASTAGGLKETFAIGASGAVFSGYDAAVLAEMIVRLSDEPERRLAMSQAGRRFVEKFDSQSIVRQFVQNLASSDLELGLEIHDDDLALDRAPKLIASQDKSDDVLTQRDR